MRWNGAIRPRAVVGVVALGSVAVLLSAVPLVPAALLLGFDPLAGVLAAAVVGVVGSALLGPALVDRRIGRLPDGDLDEEPAAALETRVESIAADVGVDAPAVRVVRSGATNVAVVDGYRGATLVMSTRLLSLPDDDVDAAVRHALIRIRGRDAAVTTALLPTMVLVETLALLATLLIRRREERSDADRRVNRIHGYEPERNRIPGPLYAVAGGLLWLVLLPVWLPCALGDSLYVGGSRRAADVAVARSGDGRRDGLGDAVEFTRDAAGAGDWPPLLDRLSLVPMADAETQRVRGTSPQETRIRLARLRSRRHL